MGKGNGGLYAAVTFLAALVAILAYIGLTPTTVTNIFNGSISSQALNVINLTITGNFNLLGNGTSVSNIIFYGSNEVTYKATLSNSFSYTVTLPNKNATYKVTASWNGIFSWQKGLISSTSPFVLKTNGDNPRSSTTLIFATPPSYATSTGTAATKWAPLAWASNIVFSPVNETFQAISANVNYGGYSVRLPNFVNYAVTEYYSGSPGGNCSEGTYAVKESANSTTIPKGNWTC